MSIQSSSPVAHVKLETNGQWMVIVGHTFNGGLFLVGPFSTETKAEEWHEDHGGISIVPCLDPDSTVVDRCGYPLHEKDAFRS